MKVRDCMSPDPVVVAPDTTVAEARRLLRDWGFRHLPVVVDDRGGMRAALRDRVGGFELVGMVSDRDVAIGVRELREAVRRRHVEQLLDDDRPVEAVMSGHPHVIGVDADISKASQLLLSRQIGALPVVDRDRQLVGIITAVDCLLALQAFYRRYSLGVQLARARREEAIHVGRAPVGRDSVRAVIAVSRSGGDG